MQPTELTADLAEIGKEIAKTPRFLTLFPGITFDTKKWRYGEQGRDGRAVGRFSFGAANLITYRRLLHNKDLVKQS